MGESLTDFLMEKDMAYLKDLLDRYNIPTQHDDTKPQIVNDIELHMRSKDFHEEAEEKLVRDMLLVLDILVSNDNKMGSEKLKEQFLSRKEAKENFDPLLMRMEALGLIFEQEGDDDKKIVLPKEFTLWIERYVGKNL